MIYIETCAAISIVTYGASPASGVINEGFGHKSWSQPIGFYYLSRFAAWIVLFFILNLLDVLREGPRSLVFGGIIVLTASLVYYYYVKRGLGDLFDHEMAAWRMKMDQVLERLDHAMGRRGVHVAVERSGKRVLFPLPPLSIAVAPGWLWTKIYVGPSTDKTEILVYRLERFVEAALE